MVGWVGLLSVIAGWMWVPVGGGVGGGLLWGAGRGCGVLVVGCLGGGDWCCVVGGGAGGARGGGARGGRVSPAAWSLRVPVTRRPVFALRAGFFASMGGQLARAASLVAVRAPRGRPGP